LILKRSFVSFKQFLKHEKKVTKNFEKQHFDDFLLTLFSNLDVNFYTWN